MVRLCVFLGFSCSILGFAALPGSTPVEARLESNGTAGFNRVDLGQAVRACDVLDLATAAGVIGADTEHPGGDTEESTCLYSNAGTAILTLQLGSVELYDQISILKPHTAVSIGQRARYNVQPNGAIGVQFIEGAHSATLSVQPIGASRTDYLASMLTAARTVAERLR